MRPSRTVVVAATAVLLAALVVYLVRWSPLATENTPSPTAPPSSTSTQGTPSATPTTTPLPDDATPSPSASATTAPAGVEPTAPTPTDGHQTVGVVVTYSGWDAAESVVEVGAYAATLVDDGTCTVTLTSGARRVSSSGATLADVSTTSCGRLTVARSNVSSGTWTGIVSFDSTTRTGTSDPFEVVVP